MAAYVVQQRQITFKWLSRHWVKQWESLWYHMQRLGTGAARLSRGSTGERFAQKTPAERMLFHTAGGFQMTNPNSGNSSSMAAQSYEAWFVLFHSSFLHKQALSFTHLFTLSKSHHIAMQRRLSSGYLFFYQNCSPFSVGISTENIPAGCSDSIWNVIRHQRHERDQHSAYLEGVEEGVVYLLPDITLLFEVISPYSLGPFEGWHPIKGSAWDWAPSALRKPWPSPACGMKADTLNCSQNFQLLSCQGLNGHHSSQGSDSTCSHGAGSGSWKGAKDGNVFSMNGFGSFKFNSASWRCQRIMILNFSKEAVCSLWKTQSYRNASLNFLWI